jgi:hypothetical protein
LRQTPIGLLLCALILAGCSHRLAQVASQTQKEAYVTVDWNKVVRVSNTNATLQVVVSPLMARNAPTHDRIFSALHDLGADDVRYVPWLPYPKLAVAELEPPANGRTSWDFSLIDPFAEDFAQATEGHSTIWNFSTIPQWMFKTPQPVPYPSDPNQVTWKYEQGRELRDPSMKEVADYYGRLVSWYTRGGFKDEYGQEHASNHHYKIDYWEVLNEVDFEHFMTPQFYTALYDAIVGAIRKVDPHMKFVGLALASTSPNAAVTGMAPAFFEYFLNHRNHKPGIPIDMISYHFYATPTADQTPEVQQYTFFALADYFVDEVGYIESIRRRLSPETGTTADEVGSFLYDDNAVPHGPIPDSYWNLSAVLYAYVYGNLARLGIDAVGESALAQLPGFFPSVSMVDWKTGQPNARYWVLKLIHNHLGPGDKLVEANASTPYVYAQAFIGKDGRRKILLVNKRERQFQVSIPGISGGQEEFVDETTGFKPPETAHLNSNTLTLGRLGVAVVTVQP